MIKKKLKKSGERSIFTGCLLEGGEEKKIGEPRYFLFSPPKYFLPGRRKLEWKLRKKKKN